jgi:hypothetical protein
MLTQVSAAPEFMTTSKLEIELQLEPGFDNIYQVAFTLISKI